MLMVIVSVFIIFYGILKIIPTFVALLKSTTACKDIRNLRIIQIKQQLFLKIFRILRMKNKSTLIINKLKEHYNLKNDAHLARFLEIPATTLASWKSRDSIDRDFLYAKCEGISGEFLQSGKGEAFTESKKNDIVSDNNGSYTSKKKIPLYDDVSSIGGTNIVANTSAVSVPSEWIDAGDWFVDATAAIRHYGDSMNEYPSGSILVLRKVNDWRLLVWGRNYCVETTEFRVTKQLQDGGDSHVIGYSTNKDTYPDGRQIHAPIYIPKDNTLLAIYIVLGCVTKEYSNGAIPIKNNLL